MLFEVPMKWLIGLTLIALGGCGSNEYITRGTGSAAGADATIQLEEIEGGNALVAIEVRHLLPPSRVDSDCTTYVAWFTPEGQSPNVAGKLEYDEDDRVGVLRATSPDAAFEVRITAEESEEAAEPSEHVIVRQRVALD
jgi:hypothetical protein